jgi:uncharacterized protein
MKWETKLQKNLKIKTPVIIQGMPGIGSVGKITADLLSEQLKAKNAVSFFSHCMPNYVMVNKNNTIELPKVEMRHAKVGKQDFLFLVGDFQPTKEEDSYGFAEAVLSTAKHFNAKEVVALGGIGLAEEPADIRVFCTGNDKKLIETFAKKGANDKLYGVVGPIMGITGLTLGLGERYGLKCATLLADTYAGPMHVGMKESREILKVLDKKYSFGINFKNVERDIQKFEKEVKPLLQPNEHMDHDNGNQPQDTSYIG